MPIEPGDHDELGSIIENAGNFFEDIQERHRQLITLQNAAVAEKGLLPEGFSTTVYTAYVQPDDPNVSSEDIALNRWQERRFPKHTVVILWDWEFDQSKKELISTVGNPTQPPNGIPATRSGMVLEGPERAGGGLPVMVVEE